jgi:hypothetical protein
MVIAVHVLIAILSVIFTGYTFLSPSQTKLRVSYSLVALTVASGTYLVITMPAHLVQSCVTGLVFIGVSLTGIAASKRKLAKISVHSDN